MIPKFRAYLKEEEIIVDIQEINYKYKEIAYVRGRYTELADFKDVELLQSTGLKDKNDVEIFEGDVLKVFVLDNKGPHAKVIFKNGMFGIEDDMFGYGYDKGLYSLDQILSIRDAEIIGNIYEHPHLLK